jgi:hypothetical protein
MKRSKLCVSKIPSIRDVGVQLQLEMPEKFTVDFNGEENDQVIKEIKRILMDDDSDLIYFDKELNVLDDNLTASILQLNNSSTSVSGKTNGEKVTIKDKNSTSISSKANTTNTSFSSITSTNSKTSSDIKKSLSTSKK